MLSWKQSLSGGIVRIGDRVKGEILAGEGTLNGSIIGMESENVIVEFPPMRPFAVLQNRLIPDGPGCWRIIFNSKADIPER